MSQRPFVQPVLILWDLENMHPSREFSVAETTAAIRGFIDSSLDGAPWFEADFAVVCDVRRESSQLIDEINDAQITVIHVNSLSKNAADIVMKLHVQKFATQNRFRPACLVMITSDMNFAPCLHVTRHCARIKTIVLHNQTALGSLTHAADIAQDFYGLLRETQLKNDHYYNFNKYYTYLLVANIPEEVPEEQVRARLLRLAKNTGGRIIDIRKHLAMMKFPTPGDAVRAKTRMDNRDVFGNLVSTYLSDAP